MGKLYEKYIVAGAILSLVVTFTTAAAVADTGCTPETGTECNAIPNSVCDDATSKCKCKTEFKEEPAGTCVLKVVADTSCTPTSGTECNAIPNSVCDAGTSKCKCKTEYKEEPAATCALRVLGNPCTAGADAECAGITNAVCKPTDNVCACLGKYKQDGGACVQKGLTDSCTASSDCDGVTGATCNTNCVCEGSYKLDPADNTKCKRKGLGDSCSASAECTPGDENSECSSGSCVCKNDYTAINNVCRKGLNNTCSKDEDCSGVSNAVCVGTPQKCACRTAFEEINGQCSSAFGLQTLLSAPVALLLSFLTIVVTRLH